MEKRDILVIFVAIIIVLIMAMYIKPLVTGKEAKLIPDEISGLFSNNNTSPNNENRFEESSRTDGPISQVPLIKSITPDTMKPFDPTASIDVIGENFKETMLVRVFSDSDNKTYNITLDGGKLRAENLMLSEGNWTVKIVDTDSNVTYNTQHIIQVIPTPTPVPTWDGNPKPLDIKEKYETNPWGRVYPSDQIVNTTKMNTYINFSGVTGVISNPISIPYGYWDIVYTVDYRTEIANPKNDEVFEFNRQFKEPNVSYEGNFTLLYLSGNPIPILVPNKQRVEGETSFRPSKDTVLTKIPKDEEPNATPPFETETTEYETGSLPALVETVGYMKPVFQMVITNFDNPSDPPIVITPSGGIDPLQWDEAVHKKEAEKIMTQKGKKEYFDSEEYQDAWEDKWKSIKDPRPWKERIYGPGNYTFDIFTQSIDSYNIQILVPEATWTQNQSDEDVISKNEKENIRFMLNSFVNNFNEIISPEYFSNLSEYIDIHNYSSDDMKLIMSNYMQARAAGIIIKDTILNDVSLRGYLGKTNKLVQSTDATIKGSFKIDYNGYEKYVPFDIELKKVDNKWKFVNSPVIRY
jgi:hypothetical protein